MTADRSAVTSSDHPEGAASKRDFDTLSTPLPDHAQDAFLIALDAVRAYDAGNRPSVGTYTGDRTGQVIQALLDAGYLVAPSTDSALEKARGEAHHHLQPLIGWLRLQVAHPDRPRFSGLEDQAVIDRLFRCLDAVDAACGHQPMREEIAAMKARIAASRTQQ